jgi:hypothetical protein
MTVVGGVFAAALIAALASPAAAADIKLLPHPDQPVTVSLTGRIVEGDAERFLTVANLAKTEGHTVTAVALDSLGGLIAEAAKIAVSVRGAGIATEVASGATCTSACFLIFAAGEQKLADPGARIGVHSAKDLTGTETDRSATSTLTMARILRSFGVPERIIGRMVVATPDQVAWLTLDELRSMEVTMLDQPDQRPAPPGTKDQLPIGRLRTTWPLTLPTIADPKSQPSTSPQSLIPQRVVLYEEDPTDAQGKSYLGSVVWRTVAVSPAGLAVRADLEIPERRMTMTMSIRRNTDQALPASHVVEIVFNLAADFPFGGISNVPGILMKQAEQTRGAPLAGLAVKIMSGSFLVGLSAVDSEMKRNLELLRERSWVDLPIVYNNGRRAILAIEKGAPGDRVFNEALATWRDRDVPANDVLKTRPSEARPAAPSAHPDHARGDWTIQLGAFSEEGRARERLKEAQSMAQNLLHRAEGYTEKVVKGSRELYRARFAGLDKDGAEAACHYFKRNDIACMALKN